MYCILFILQYYWDEINNKYLYILVSFKILSGWKNNNLCLTLCSIRQIDAMVPKKMKLGSEWY